jgi:GDPmannose 4,6-dehydratase
MKRALITGITGQDGSYLTELLLSKGYEVHGIVRRSSVLNTERIDHLYVDPHEPAARVRLHYGDLLDGSSLRKVIEEVRPDEIYNLGAQSHVAVSFKQPEYSVDVDGLGTLRLLEAVRDYQRSSGASPRFYQAGTSEMFGSIPPPQNEKSGFHPRSPYACAKLFAYHQVINYRESYDMFAANGILFNHESERRGETFVTRKVTHAAARIKMGSQRHVYLGNLDAKRDWGHAEDFVEAMWRILQHDEPDDFVVATGHSHSVGELVIKVFGMLDLNWEDHVLIDPKYYRPAEVEHLHGDASKARRLLGWEPRVNFDQLITRMVNHDLDLAKQEKLLKGAGHVVVTRGLATF